jgi:hypothetical protein
MDEDRPAGGASLSGSFCLGMWFSEKIGLHPDVVRVDAEIPVTKPFENGTGAQVPTRPGQRGIAVHVLGVDFRTRIEEQLDGFFSAERGGAVQRRLQTSK